MNAFPNNAEFWKIQFNLGIAMIQSEQYTDALELFQQLQEEELGEAGYYANYHVLYSFYQLKKYQEIVDLVQEIAIEEFPNSLQEDVALMLSVALYKIEKIPQSFEVLQQAWKSLKSLKNLEFLVYSHYREDQFQEAIHVFQQRGETTFSPFLFRYFIKSLLSLRKTEEATQNMEKFASNRAKNLRLWMEVWIAKQDYDSLIQTVQSLLKRKATKQKRLLYYLALGNAFFNQQKYQKSKNQFYKALPLTQDIQKKSFIQYNLILATYYYGDFPTFQREANLFLDRKLTPFIRYNITRLLAFYYLEQNEFAQSDSLIEGYLKTQEFEKTAMNLLRLQGLIKAGEYLMCFNLAQQPLPEESAFQRRDRVAYVGRCGNLAQRSKQAIPVLQQELTKEENFRSTDLRLMLAEAQFSSQSYQESCQFFEGNSNRKRT